MEPQVAASVAPKREWARLSKAARARRKLESDELRRQAQALEAQRAALLPRGAEGHGSDEVRREAEAQRARRRVAEAANDALKAEARRLARNAERAGALLDKALGQEADGEWGDPRAPPLAYHAETDDAVFEELEARQRSQYEALDAVFEAAGLGQAVEDATRHEVMDECSTDANWDLAAAGVVLRMTNVKLVPFSREIVAAGIQRHGGDYCCVCRSTPIEASTGLPGCGTRRWLKMRYWLRDVETGNRATLLVRGVLAFIHQQDRIVSIWTATTFLEPDYSEIGVEDIMTDERAWSVIDSLPVPGGKSARHKSAAHTVSRIRGTQQIAPRVSRLSGLSPEAQKRVVIEVILPAQQQMMKLSMQGMENGWCDEMWQNP